MKKSKLKKLQMLEDEFEESRALNKKRSAKKFAGIVKKSEQKTLYVVPSKAVIDRVKEVLDSDG